MLRSTNVLLQTPICFVSLVFFSPNAICRQKLNKRWVKLVMAHSWTPQIHCGHSCWRENAIGAVCHSQSELDCRFMRREFCGCDENTERRQVCTKARASIDAIVPVGAGCYSVCRVHCLCFSSIFANVIRRAFAWCRCREALLMWRVNFNISVTTLFIVLKVIIIKVMIVKVIIKVKEIIIKVIIIKRY